MSRTYKQQKSALTRVQNSGDERKIIAEVARAKAEWETWDYGWPDGWSRWEMAEYDARNSAARKGIEL